MVKLISKVLCFLILKLIETNCDAKNLTKLHEDNKFTYLQNVIWGEGPMSLQE